MSKFLAQKDRTQKLDKIESRIEAAMAQARAEVAQMSLHQLLQARSQRLKRPVLFLFLSFDS